MASTSSGPFRSGSTVPPQKKRITVLGSIKTLKYFAVSAGSDSIGALEFVIRGKHRPTLLHFRHGTKHANDAYQFILEYCYENKLDLITEGIRGKKPKDQSWEEWWRNKRYDFFHHQNGLIATAHTLNDVAETWLMGAIHGKSKIIPYRNRNVVRPFLLNTKEALRSHANKWLEDPGNRDLKYDRTKIRNMMHLVKSVNPGYFKVVSKKVKEHYERENQ